MTREEVKSDASQTAIEAPKLAAKRSPRRSTAARDERHRLRLTARDYEILRFIYEQKFATLEALYLRFFDGRGKPSDPLPPGFFVARQRLSRLRRAGLLITERVYTDPKAVYLISQAGLRTLAAKMPNAVFAKALTGVDFRCFEHDMKVTIVRVGLARFGKGVKWYPERRVRSEGYSIEAGGRMHTLPETLIPDGIMVSSKGERVAIELEASIRRRSRFQFKIEEYERVMAGDAPVIEKVLFVVTNKTLFNELKRLTDKKPGFLVDYYQNYLESMVTPIARRSTAPAGAAQETSNDAKAANFDSSEVAEESAEMSHV